MFGRHLVYKFTECSRHVLEVPASNLIGVTEYPDFIIRSLREYRDDTVTFVLPVHLKQLRK